ncbi:MAG: hypothetical protein R3318_06015, partial [Gammaproteobacteria bacterium]|nr:hypothetical protein [Gammaproteobacteria bacterium]
LSLVLVAVFVVMVLNREEEVKNEVINLPLPEITPAPEKAVLPEPVVVTTDTVMPDDGPKTYLDESSEADVTDESDERTNVRGETEPEPVPVQAIATAPEPLLMAETPTPERPVEAADSGDDPVLVISKTEPVVIPEPEPVSKPTATPAGPGFRGADWLKQQSPEQYVLQLLGAHDPDVINKVLSANPSVFGKVARFTTVNNNKRWHVLVYGLYPDRDRAVANIPDLPKNLQALGPWPRSIASIQADLR